MVLIATLFSHPTEHAASQSVWRVAGRNWFSTLALVALIVLLGAPVQAAPPALIQQPADVTTAAGQFVTFSVVVAEDDVSYQWQVSTDGLSFATVAGANGSSYTFKPLRVADSGHRYRAVVSKDGETVYSRPATLTLTKAISTVIVDDLPGGRVYGQTVTIKAWVIGTSAPPNGEIAFMDGSTRIGTAAFETGGGATLTMTTDKLTAGQHTITAIYSGDADHEPGVSGPVVIDIAKAEQSVYFDTIPPREAKVGQTYDVSAQAIRVSTSVPVEVRVESAGICAISNGVVTFLKGGDCVLSAQYSGDVNFNDSRKATQTIAVVSDTPTPDFSFSPPSGALPDAMVGEDYNQPISATGGTGPLLYNLLSGALPAGMVLNVSAGTLSGPLDANTQGDYSFTIQVHDTTGATGTASYTLRVSERTVMVPDQQIQVPPGSSPLNVDLTRGATGGPFIAADIVSVEPPNAGAVSIVRGEFAQAGVGGSLGWYLKFIPDPTFVGRVQVSFRLISGMGSSNTGTVTYVLVHDSAAIVAEVDGLVQDFVQTRQGLISSVISVPSLVERRSMSADPVTSRLLPSEQGMTLGFSTSLAQLEAADAGIVVAASPFNIWIDGAFLMHQSDAGASQWNSFGMISAGADYLITDHALIGLSVHFDRMSDPSEDAELSGNGWLVGPYSSLELGHGVFWDASLRYGNSTNDIDTMAWDGTFDTQRWMADTAITGQWLLDEVTTLTPKLRAVYLSETAADYAVTNSVGDVIDLSGFTKEQFRVSLGGEIARQYTLEDGMTFLPKLGLSGGFAGLDGSGAFGQLLFGASVAARQGWSLDTNLLLNMEGDGQRSIGAKFGLSGQF